MKYGEWINLWLESLKPDVKERTYNKYADTLRLHILPTLGNYELSDINDQILYDFITEKSKNGNTKNGGEMSANSINAIITMVYSSLNSANEAGYANYQKTNKIERPINKKESVDYFTKAEQKKLLEFVRKSKRPKDLGIVLSLTTGIRVGELLALKWSDIDLEKCTISITKTCRDFYNGNGYEKLIDKPQTPSSVRVVEFPHEYLQRLENCKKNAISEYVIVSRNKDISVRSYQHSFKLILKKLEMPDHSFQTLRNTFAANAIANGMSLNELARILGHKSVASTRLNYATLINRSKRKRRKPSVKTEV